MIRSRFCLQARAPLSPAFGLSPRSTMALIVSAIAFCAFATSTILSLKANLSIWAQRRALPSMSLRQLPMV